MKNREQFKNSIYKKRDRYYAEKSEKRKKAINIFTPIAACLVLCFAVLSLPLLNVYIPMSQTEEDCIVSDSSGVASNLNVTASEGLNNQNNLISESSLMSISDGYAAESSKTLSSPISQSCSDLENTAVSESRSDESSEPESLSEGWFDEVSRVRNNTSSKSSEDLGKPMCAPLRIISVKITTQPESEKYQRTYTSKDKIQTIINYLGNLELSQPTVNPDQYDGMRYIITFNYSDDSTITFVHFANKFLRINNEGWKEMNEEQAAEFEQIVSGLESD